MSVLNSKNKYCGNQISKFAELHLHRFCINTIRVKKNSQAVQK